MQFPITKDELISPARGAPVARQAKPEFKITVEGSSRTTVLSRNGDPIARFYAGRFDADLLALIERRLNRPDPDPRPVLNFATGL